MTQCVLLIMVWIMLNFLTDFTEILNNTGYVMWVTVSVCVTESHGFKSKPSITSDCVPGSDLCWPCWVTAFLRVCVSSSIHDWHEVFIKIMALKVGPSIDWCWQTLDTIQLVAFMLMMALMEQIWKANGTIEGIQRSRVTICIKEPFKIFASQTD